MPELNIDYSYWFLILSVLIGGSYSYLLYSKNSPWSQTINNLLAALRFLITSFLLFLLFNPLFKQWINKVEKPVFVIGIDNSTSILNTLDSIRIYNVLNELEQLGTKMKEKGFDVEYRSLNQSEIEPNQIIFDQKITDINSFFKEIEADFESRNLAGVLLTSDGNYNSGISPAYFPYGYRIHTLGIGDTTLKEDLILKNVLYNKIAFQGNKFPVLVEVTNEGFEQQKVFATIKTGNKILDKKEYVNTNSSGFKRLDFEVEAEKKGVNRYTIEVGVSANEAIKTNNKQDIYIDIIEGKQKILILAPSPHPDIKAIQSIIADNKNYEVDILIPGVHKPTDKAYDLVIIHQYYDRYNLTKKYVQQFKLKDVPMFHIIGQQSNEVIASNQDTDFTFKQIRNQNDKVSPAFNSDFTRFTFDLENAMIFNQYPTIDVPYGEFKLTPEADIVLYQRVGSIVTKKPLLYVKESSSTKVGYFIGDGFWQWRLQEYALNENTKVFDELFTKLIQYLSTKADKRKFRVNTSKAQYFDNEPILFSTEVYNDIYERVYGDNIELSLSNDTGYKKDFSFVSSASNFEVSGLPQGVYHYTSTHLGKKLKTAGRFTVNELHLESLDQSANFDILRQVSKNTGGTFYSMNEANLLSERLSVIKATGVIHSEEDFFTLINFKASFFLLLMLISGEWFIRKYSGGY